MWKTTILHAKNCHTKNWVANCSATPDKLFPDKYKYFSSLVDFKLEIVLVILAIDKWKMETNN